MSAPAPDCPICQGRGWYEVPYYSHFEPTTQMQACPDCNAVEPVGYGGCAIIAVLAAALIAFAAWVTP